MNVEAFPRCYRFPFFRALFPLLFLLLCSLMMLFRGQGVTAGRREELSGAAVEKAATRSPAGQSRFHNFSFPTISWGSQRILRCVIPVPGIEGSAAGSKVSETQIDPQNKGQASYSPGAGDSMEKQTEQEEPPSAAASSAKPWNLRTRRASCYAPSESRESRFPKPLMVKYDPAKASTLRSMAGESGKRRQFSVSLSREQIEEDFYAFKGSKPNRRPKKRPKIVQKQLDVRRNFKFRAKNSILVIFWPFHFLISQFILAGAVPRLVAFGSCSR